MSTLATSTHIQESTTGTLVSPDPISVDRSSGKHEDQSDPSQFPSTIPPEHPNRTLVLCFDGTGDHFDSENSNIVQFVSLLSKGDRTKQMVYYQAGIGTYTSGKNVTPFGSKIYKILDDMVAWNLDSHVMDGYEFLMQNYKAGDRICIFGFSRGAYTARSLAGMIHKVGLLPADNKQQVPFAYKMYTKADAVGWEQSNAFKDTFSIDVDIEFVGVWDTVDSVGFIPKRLPFTTSNKIVRTFRHAVSLDERRAKFKANLWNRPNADEVKLGLDPDDDDDDAPLTPPPHLPFLRDVKKQTKTSSKVSSKADKMLDKYERMYSEKAQKRSETDVQEVWFSGCHCDIGGGAVSNGTRNALARISFRWMIRECFKTCTGIMFESKRLRAIGLDPAMLYPYVTPRPAPLPVGVISYQKISKPPSMMKRLASMGKAKPKPVEASGGEVARQDTPMSSVESTVVVGSEEEEDLKDALSPMYDQLSLKRGWWILEILPLKLRYQRGNNEWVSYIGSNLGKPRYIPKQRTSGVKVHRTVKMRMEASHPKGKPKKYRPRANLLVEPTWVD